MKRLLAAAAVALAFFSLAAVVSQPRVYSWAADALNAPCGKSILEYNLASQKIDAAPVPLKHQPYDIVKMVGEARPDGLYVRIDLVIRKGATFDGKIVAEKLKTAIVDEAYGVAIDCFCPGHDPDSEHRHCIATLNGQPFWASDSAKAKR